MPVEVILGGVTIPVIPQKHAYLSHRLGPAIQGAIDSGEGVSGDNIGQWLSGGAYAALSALIPTLPGLIPEYAFQGYSTAAAQEAGEFDPDAQPPAGCPTIPEIETAFRTAMAVNGIDKLVELGKAVAGPEGLRVLRLQLVSELANSISSPISASPSGESDSTSSGTTAPTSSESLGSPSPVSPA
jgi:hypothetical protein